MSKFDNSILFSLSPHIFWDCDVKKLDYKKDYKIIIERIAEYGLEKDEKIMWVLYTYKIIKNIILNINYLPYLRILYYSIVLEIKEEKFKCYRNKSFHYILEKEVKNYNIKNNIGLKYSFLRNLFTKLK